MRHLVFVVVLVLAGCAQFYSMKTPDVFWQSAKVGESSYE